VQVVGPEASPRQSQVECCRRRESCMAEGLG
jgi:hypothetical protein